MLIQYHDMIRQIMLPILVGMDQEIIWFQQDGGTCHSVQATHFCKKGFRTASYYHPDGDFTSCDLWLLILVKL